MYALLTQRRLRCLGHVYPMSDGRFPKHYYVQLTIGSRPTGRPMLRCKDACKRDMKSSNINANTWEQSVANRSNWCQSIYAGIILAEEKKANMWSDKRTRRTAAATLSVSLPSSFLYSKYSRYCHSMISLFSHSRFCSKLCAFCISDASLLSSQRRCHDDITLCYK